MGQIIHDVSEDKAEVSISKEILGSCDNNISLWIENMILH